MPQTTIEWLRGPKVFNMSIFDWVGSLLIAYIIGNYMLHLRGVLTWCAWILVWTAFGVFAHWATGVNTMLGYYLGINPRPERHENP